MKGLISTSLRSSTYVEVLAVQLLDELEHHSIASAFPHVTVGAEALCPSSLASLDITVIVSWAI